jgi:phage terminase Nu1 subunit (DNA packaging protein)
MPRVTSVRELGRALGLAHTTLNRHLKQGKFRPERDGSFDVDKVKAALAKNRDVEQPTQAAGGDPAYAEYNLHRSIREKYRAKREEMDLRERMGELVERSTVQTVWGEVTGNVRNQLLLLPDRVAPRIAAITDVLECRFLLDREVRQALAELTEHAPEPV